MSGPAAGQEPPGARPSVRAALLLMVTVVVGAVVWIVVSFITGGPEPSARPDSPGSTPTGPWPPSSASAPFACDPPPPPPASVPSFSTAPDVSLAQGASWTATLHTTCGVVTLSLDGRAAPQTVSSFLHLARAGYWNDSACQRLTSRQEPTAFLQCGDPSTARSLVDPGYALPLENVPADRHYTRGTLAMARQPWTTNTAGEFILVYEDFTVPVGDPVYPVFGRVVGGMGVVDAIASRGGEDTRPDGPPFTSISIRTIDVVRGSGP